MSSLIATASVSSSAATIDITGFKPSGISYGNAIAICNYVWSGGNSDGDWVPLRREWLTD
jgi:hypothetical protein